MQDDEQPKQRSFRWNPEVSLGSLLQAGVVIVSVILFVVGSNLDGKNTSRNLERQEVALKEGLAQLRAEMSQGFLAVQGAIANIPDLNARINQAERRIESLDSRNLALENRVGRISDGVIELRVQVDGIARASDSPLGGRPTSRPNR